MYDVRLTPEQMKDLPERNGLECGEQGDARQPCLAALELRCHYLFPDLVLRGCASPGT